MLNLAFLSIKDIWKSFDGFKALKGVNLDIKKGEFVVILGPSGCGKTTTLRVIAGVIKPDKGTILLDGEDVTDWPPWKRDVGFVYQNLALFPHLTVTQNISFGLEARGYPKKIIKERVTE